MDSNDVSVGPGAPEAKISDANKLHNESAIATWGYYCIGTQGGGAALVGTGSHDYWIGT